MRSPEFEALRVKHVQRGMPLRPGAVVHEQQPGRMHRRCRRLFRLRTGEQLDAIRLPRAVRRRQSLKRRAQRLLQRLLTRT